MFLCNFFHLGEPLTFCTSSSAPGAWPWAYHAACVLVVLACGSGSRLAARFWDVGSWDACWGCRLVGSGLGPVVVLRWVEWVVVVVRVSFQVSAVVLVAGVLLECFSD